MWVFLGSFMIVFAGVLFLVKKNILASGFLVASIFPFLIIMSATKAVFSWLGMLSLLLMLVVVLNGLLQKTSSQKTSQKHS